MKNLESFQILPPTELQNTQGGWLDLSWVAIVEEFVDYDLNENGITGVGCILGC